MYGSINPAKLHVIDTAVNLLLPFIVTLQEEQGSININLHIRLPAIFPQGPPL